MKVPFVDLKAQYQSIKEEIDQSIDKVIESASFIGGEEVKFFERDFASILGVQHCVGVANGTDAIYIALKMLGIGKGDEVITVANSWIATSETITQVGAKPVFVDIDPDTYTIDVSKIESKINGATRAIIPVHLYGQAAQISSIKQICDKKQLMLIEDCAQSHLTEDDGKYVGTFGNVSTYSFYPGKNLGAYGDAGCIVTDDNTLAEKCRMYANHGALVKHQHKIEGVNSRLDTIQAAILRAKLPYLKNWTSSRIKNAKLYTEKLSKIEDLFLPEVRPNTVHSFHLYVVRTPRRDELRKFLEEKGIQTAIHYPTALPNMEAYKYLGHTSEEFPIATQYQNQILSLPMYAELSENQIDYVCNQIHNFFEVAK